MEIHRFAQDDEKCLSFEGDSEKWARRSVPVADPIKVRMSREIRPRGSTPRRISVSHPVILSAAKNLWYSAALKHCPVRY